MWLRLLSPRTLSCWQPSFLWLTSEVDILGLLTSLHWLYLDHWRLPPKSHGNLWVDEQGSNPWEGGGVGWQRRPWTEWGVWRGGVLFNRSVTIVIIKACVRSAVSAGLCLLLVGQFVTDRQYCWVGFGNLFLGLFSTYMYMYTKIGVNQKQKKILGRVQRL